MGGFSFLFPFVLDVKVSMERGAEREIDYAAPQRIDILTCSVLDFKWSPC